MAITFVPLYPNVVALDRFIDNLITLLSDVDYQAGALYWAANGVTLDDPEQPDEPIILAPYVLVSESAVWREEDKTPTLLIKDVSTEAEDDEGPLLRQVHRFSVYQCLSLHGEHEALMREAYWRSMAVDMMIRSARRSGFNLFNGTGIIPGSVLVQVKRRNYGDTVTGRPSYYRYPSVDVEIPTRETQ